MRNHEYLFLFSKSRRYYYDEDSTRLPLAERTETTYGSVRHPNGGGDLVKSDNWGRGVMVRKPAVGPDGKPLGVRLRSVWTICREASGVPEHFATYPTELARRCVLASCPVGGTVLDPFLGSGTTALVADRLGRHAVGIELSPRYADAARHRIEADAPLLNASAEVDDGHVVGHGA